MALFHNLAAVDDVDTLREAFEAAIGVYEAAVEGIDLAVVLFFGEQGTDARHVFLCHIIHQILAAIH